MSGEYVNNNAGAPTPSNPKRNGISAGVILILIGVMFLVGQLVPGLAWWTLWPVVFIAIGLVRIFSPARFGTWRYEPIFDGIGSVLFGLVLLGNTTGYISWGIWWTLLLLWPVLIVSVGIRLLAKGLDQGWLRVIAHVVIWIALGYAVSTAWAGTSGLNTWPALVRSGGEAFSFSDTGTSVKTATLNLQGGLGEINITGGSGLISATGTSPFGTPTFGVTRSGENAVVAAAIGQSGSSITIVPGSPGAKADIKLSQDVLWDATFETGASSLDADLSQVKMRNLVVKTGVSSVTLRLGDVPDGQKESTLVLKAGVSSVKILLPAGVQAKIVAQNGLSSTSVNGAFVKSGNTWKTSGYDSASKVWTINTESGVGSISVETY
ncbi:MAG: hypothetical protein HGA39_03850 [Coriobacteriia bacterium]|nr:hypothetical protein [Coriobacteriia bacterium]